MQLRQELQLLVNYRGGCSRRLSSSEQRVRWFRRGYETGDLRQGDTFNARDL
jgi:hypothetical protein